MPPIGTLYLSSPTQGQATVARAVAALTKTELLPTPPDYKHFVTNSTPEWLAKFPLGKVPAFEGVDGFRLTEGIAIARYIAVLAGRDDLFGLTPKEAALVDQWQSFVATELSPHLGHIFALNNYWIPFPGQVTYDRLVQAAERAFEALNRYIATFGPNGGKRKFVATEETVTVADLALAAVVGTASGWFLDDVRRAKWPELAGYFEGVVGSADVLKDIYGPLKTCEKAVVYVPKVEDAAK